MSDADDLVNDIIKRLLDKSMDRETELAELKVEVRKIPDIEEYLKKLDEKKMNKPKVLIEVQSKTSTIIITAVSAGLAGWLFGVWNKILIVLAKLIN